MLQDGTNIYKTNQKTEKRMTTADRIEVERLIAVAIQHELGNLVALFQTAICEGMNIECGASVSLKDLFALLDTSITDRIRRSTELHEKANGREVQ